MAFAHPSAQSFAAPIFAFSFGATADSHRGYWQARIADAVQQLTHEARRMLKLEAQLAEFAGRYYAAVGESVWRLMALDAALAGEEHASECAAELAEADAYLGGPEERGQELKSRYRALAKELHPDRGAVGQREVGAAEMHMLTEAYQRGDLAALLALDAELALMRCARAGSGMLEEAVHDVSRAAETYARGYRDLLNSPLNELMLRAMAAESEGRDWLAEVVAQLTARIQEKEQALTGDLAMA